MGCGRCDRFSSGPKRSFSVGWKWYLQHKFPTLTQRPTALQAAQAASPAPARRGPVELGGRRGGTNMGCGRCARLSFESVEAA